MAEREFPISYGDQDLLGGAMMGEYRQGVLAGGHEYHFETVGIRTALHLSSGKDSLFLMWLQDQRGVILALPEKIDVFYDQAGNMGWASLSANRALYEAFQQDKIVLPEEVVARVRNQLLNGVEWRTVMNFAAGEPHVFFARDDRPFGDPYHLQFGGGWRYPIPGVNWGVGVIRSGDLVGFEISGVDGAGLKFWFNRNLDQRTLPTAATVSGLTLDDLKEAFFPGYPLAIPEGDGRKN